MSRTDKDRPAWVRRFDHTIGTHIEHDHRDGICEEETFADARAHATSRRRLRDHRYGGRCAAYAQVEVRCNGRWKTYLAFDGDPFEHRCIKTYECGFGWLSFRVGRCNDGVHIEWRPTGRTCAACDEIERQFLLCRRELDDSWVEWRRSMRPRHAAGTVNRAFERPHRQRARRALRDAAAEWNTFGDTDIQPDPPVTRGASWLFW